MTAKQTGHILDSAVPVRNGGTMLQRATACLLKRVGTYLTEGYGHFEQLL
jgi:hypothetical protein